MTIRVGSRGVIRSHRLPGSHTIYQTIVEWDGQRLPNVYESTDPHEAEHVVAARLRVILERSGLPSADPGIIQADPSQGIYVSHSALRLIGRYVLAFLFFKACI